MNIFSAGAVLNSKQYVKDFTKTVDERTHCGVIPYPALLEKGYLQYPYSLVHKLGFDYFDEIPETHYIEKDLYSNITLKNYQEDVVNQLIKSPYGILISAPGTGKTIMGVELIHRLSYKTLILVNSLFLLEQWYNVILEQLNYEAGKIGGGNYEFKDITIATFQTLRKQKQLIDQFSLVIIDEVHHVPASTFRETLSNISALWKLGLTGTYKRKDGLEFLTNWFVGDNILENLIDDTLKPEIIIVKTGIKVDEGRYVDSLSGLASNEQLIEIILNNVEKCANRKQLIIPFRLETVEILADALPDAIVVIGKTEKQDRENLNERVLEHPIIISTVLQEGSDIPNLDTLHLIHPNNNLPMLEQRIKRICRTLKGKKTPLVFDYFFKDSHKAEYNVESQQNIRLNFYKQQNWKIYVIS